MKAFEYGGHTWTAESLGSGYESDQQHFTSVRFACAATNRAVTLHVAVKMEEFDRVSTQVLHDTLSGFVENVVPGGQFP